MTPPSQIPQSLNFLNEYPTEIQAKFENTFCTCQSGAQMGKHLVGYKSRDTVPLSMNNLDDILLI